MNEDTVGLLYDALHAFESPHRKSVAYPVHKKLRADTLGAMDIYDWIADRIDPPRRGSILDAGCGVGFGTLRLVQRTDCRVTGISVSAREIAVAQRSAKQANLAARTRFRRLSFDELPAASYDVIVAVESLKHSSNLVRSLRSMLRSLKRGGELLIVEDLFTDGRHNAFARRLADSWGLAKLYAESDYLAVLGAANCAVTDLSRAVRRKRKLALAARLMAVRLAVPFAGRGTSRALRAFRGGLYLQHLYADAAVAYKAIVYRGAGRDPF